MQFHSAIRRLVILAVLVIVLPVSALAGNGDVTVYITNTGDCYHESWCYYLKSRNEVKLSEAAHCGYRPCSYCNPPLYDETAAQIPEPAVTAPVEAPKPAYDLNVQPELEDIERNETEENNNRYALYWLIGITVVAPIVFGTCTGVAMSVSNRISQKRALASLQRQVRNLPDVVREPAIVQESIPEQRTSLKPPPPKPSKSLPEPSGPLKLPTAPRPSKPSPEPPKISYRSSAANPDAVKLYQDLQAGKTLAELADVPSWAYVDGRGFPQMLYTDADDIFSVFVTQSGQCYHKAGCRCVRSGHAINICEALQKGKLPCGHCKPMNKLPPFVVRYQYLRHLIDFYSIPTNNHKGKA